MPVTANRRLIFGLVIASMLLTLTACGGAQKPAPAAASSSNYGSAQPTTQPASSAPASPTTPAPTTATPATPPAAPATTPAAVAAPAPLQLTMTLKDFSFEPKEITAVKGQKIILTLKNQGDRKHDIVLQGPYDGMKSEQIDAGKEGTYEFVADKVGNFEFICDLRGHKDRGMVGKLIVSEK